MNRDRLAGAASIAIGIGIAANALLGPLVLGVIRIRDSAAMETQVLGGERRRSFSRAVLTLVGVIASGLPVLWLVSALHPSPAWSGPDAFAASAHWDADHSVWRSVAVRLTVSRFGKSAASPRVARAGRIPRPDARPRTADARRGARRRTDPPCQRARCARLPRHESTRRA